MNICALFYFLIYIWVLVRKQKNEVNLPLGSTVKRPTAFDLLIIQ